MDNDKNENIGRIGWIDLTVAEAGKVRDFYGEVVGWSHQSVSMGEYDDFCMVPPGGEAPVAGICHALGENKSLPSQWLMYITVADLDASVSQCEKLGGKLILGPKNYGDKARYCVIQDPAGAHLALYAEEE